MGYKLWTEEEIATLKELAGKLSAAQIAQRLGRGYAATIFKAHHLKLSLRRYAKVQGERAEKARAGRR